MIYVNEVRVYPDSITIRQGEWDYGVWAEVCPTYATKTDVQWHSSNTSVASVGATNGYIYGVGPGTATIYATAIDGSGASDSVTVTVTNQPIYVSDIALNKSSVTLQKESTTTLSATVSPSNASNKALCWTSDNESIATVDNTGKVTALSNGSVWITASAKDGSGCEASCRVTVTSRVLVTSITVSALYYCGNMTVGDSDLLEADVYPTDATNKNVRWSSSDSSIVFVNPNSGLITALKAGTATITATAKDGSGKKGSYTVSVSPAVSVESVCVSPKTKTMNVGQTAYLDVTICPANATDKRVTWCSSDEDVATVDYYSGLITAKKPGTVTIRASSYSDPNIYSSSELWIKGKTPVFLIHGRSSNSEGVWGVKTKIPVGKNDDFAPSINATALNGKRYIDVCAQEISCFLENPGGSENPCYLGNELRDAGYKENVNLFVFNYPNEDAVVHDAKKFEAYINNLISDVRNSGTAEMKACFYNSRADYLANNYKINLVGHSMGGLVARYYIENLWHDNHVDKLITICTPHWGSPLAELSNSTGILHKLCDHDLDEASAMYGGENETELKEGCTLWDVTDIWHDCADDKYILTDELQYNGSRSTQYYAIAGIDYDSDGMSDNNFKFELQNVNASYNEINNEIIQRSQNRLYVLRDTNETTIRVEFNVAYVRDNVVPFLSQIGWASLGENGIPSKKISFKKIFVNIDTDGGNSLTSHFHGKMTCRKEVTDIVKKYLEE